MSDLTLSRALGWNDPACAKAASQLDARKETLLTKFEVPWPALRQTLLERLAEQLDIPCSGLLLAAWKKHEELREFADAAKHPLGEVNRVNLIDHEVEYDYPVTLDVSLGSLRFSPVQLHLHVKLELEGVKLTIRDAKIIAVTPGSCRATAELTMSEAVLLNAESKSVDLGEEYTLGDPVSLATV